MDLADLLPHLYAARVSAPSISFANLRHVLEIQVLSKFPLPGRFILIPGVINPTINFIEHPEVVAKRIAREVSALGDK